MRQRKRWRFQTGPRLCGAAGLALAALLATPLLQWPEAGAETRDGTLASAPMRELPVTEHFTRVHVQGPARVMLSQGRVHQLAVSRAAGTDALALEVMDGTLYVSAPRTLSDPLMLRVTLPELDAIVAGAGSQVQAGAFVVEDLRLEGQGDARMLLHALTAREVVVSGRDGARFDLSGVARRQVVNLEGSSDYRAERLRSETGEVSVRGGADVVLAPERFLDVLVSGASRVMYSGVPAVRQRVSGSGYVGRLGF